MKNVIVYVLGIILLFPCVLIASDSLTGCAIGMGWGCLMWHSPKFSPLFKRFWRSFWKANYRLLYFIEPQRD